MGDKRIDDAYETATDVLNDPATRYTPARVLANEVVTLRLVEKDLKARLAKAWERLDEGADMVRALIDHDPAAFVKMPWDAPEMEAWLCAVERAEEVENG